MRRRAVRSAVIVSICLWTASAAFAADADAGSRAGTAAGGLLKVGQAVEVLVAGDWNPGTVTYAEGLDYFVHWGPEMDRGHLDRFFHLTELRVPGARQTLDEQYRAVIPDPAGGPVGLGQVVEFDHPFNWIKWRVARRAGARYVLFPEDAREAHGAEEAWAGLNEMRAVGSQRPFAAAPPPKPRTPTKLADVAVGDVVSAYRKGGYGWGDLTVMAIDHGRYYVQPGADSTGSWITAVHMRAVGSKERFEPEDLGQFAGDWSLHGDAFFTTVSSVQTADGTERTQALGSGAGQDAGRVTINADGTYVVTKTAVFHDDAPGKWVRNPDQDEGGILLQDGDSEGKDLLVTPYPDGIYLQGALRGPGKIGTKK